MSPIELVDDYIINVRSLITPEELGFQRWNEVSRTLLKWMRTGRARPEDSRLIEDFRAYLNIAEDIEEPRFGTPLTPLGMYPDRTTTQIPRERLSTEGVRGRISISGDTAFPQEELEI